MGCCSSTPIVPEPQPQAIKIKLNKNDPKNEKDKELEFNDQKVDEKNRITEPKTNEVIEIEKGENEEIKSWKQNIQDLLSIERLNQHIYARKRTDFRSVEDLANYFKIGPANNDLERYWMIFVWIAENITYNMTGYLSGNFGKNDAETVFRTGLAVCEGFSTLYDALCKIIGLECARLSGYAKGTGYKIGDKFTSTNHAWNSIKVNEKWYYLDATWAGRKKNNTSEINDLSPYWFMTPPDIFLESHYSPEMKLHRKCTKEEFENLHYYKLEYHVLGLKNDSINGSLITCNSNPFFLEFKSLQDCDLLIKLKDGSTEIPNAIIYQKDITKKPIKHGLIIFAEVKNKNYFLHIFGKGTGSEKKSYSELTKFILRREEKELNIKIPDYNISFLNGKIKLLSQKSSLIYYNSDPLVLEFSTPASAKMLANLKNLSDEKKNENNILIQRNPKNNNILVYVLSEESKKRMILSLFSTEADQGSYPLIGDLHIFKTSDLKFSNKFVQKYSSKYEHFIYEPILNNLKLNQTYKFKFYVEKALTVFFTNQNSNEIFIEKSETEENIYEIEYKPDTIGKLQLNAKYEFGSSYSILCVYEINNS